MTDFPFRGRFSAAAVNAEFDTLYLKMQEIARDQDRAFTLSPADTTSTITLPDAAERASNVLGFDSAGAPVARSQLDQSAQTVTATGTTTARSLAERAAEVLNLRDFGAKGDNITDDTNAVKAWIAALGSGQLGYMPAGIYRVSDEIVIDKAVTIIGDSPFVDADRTVFGGTWFRLIDSSGLTASQGLLNIQHSDSPASATNRRFVTIERIGFFGNKTNNTNGNGIVVSARNVTLDRLAVLEFPDDGILAQDDGDHGANSSYFHNLWLGYNGGDGFHFDRTSQSGDNHIVGGHYHLNDEAGIRVNQTNVTLTSVFTWWSRDGFWADPTASSIVDFVGCHAYDNARAGLYLDGAADNINVTGGHYNGNGNDDRWSSLPGSPTFTDPERAGIYAAGAVQNIQIKGVSVGFLHTAPSSAGDNQIYGISSPDAGASINLDVPDGEGATAQILNLNTSATHRLHGNYSGTPVLTHPGFRALDDIDLDNNDLVDARSFSLHSDETLTTITSNAVTVTRSSVVLNVSGGGTINDITWAGAASGQPLLFLRNLNATAVTLSHNTSKLRLLSGANVSLGQHKAVVLLRLTGTVWQQIGGKI